MDQENVSSITLQECEGLVKNKHFQEALEKLDLLRSSVALESLTLLYIRTFLGLERYEECLVFIAKELEKNPKNYQVLLFKIRVLIDLRRVEEANYILIGLCAKYPRRPDLLRLKLELATGISSTVKIISTFEELLIAGNRNTQDVIRYVEFLKELSQFHRALKEINTTFDILPLTEPLFIQQLELNIRLGYMDTALKLYAQQVGSRTWSLNFVRFVVPFLYKTNTVIDFATEIENLREFITAPDKLDHLVEQFFIDKQDSYLAYFLLKAEIFEVSESQSVRVFSALIRTQDFVTARKLATLLLKDDEVSLANARFMLEMSFNCGELTLADKLISRLLTLTEIDEDLAVLIVRCAISANVKAEVLKFIEKNYSIYRGAKWCLECAKFYARFGNTPKAINLMISFIQTSDSQGDVLKELSQFCFKFELYEQFAQFILKNSLLDKVSNARLEKLFVKLLAKKSKLFPKIQQHILSEVRRNYSPHFIWALHYLGNTTLALELLSPGLKNNDTKAEVYSRHQQFLVSQKMLSETFSCSESKNSPIKNRNNVLKAYNEIFSGNSIYYEHEIHLASWTLLNAYLKKFAASPDLGEYEFKEFLWGQSSRSLYNKVLMCEETESNEISKYIVTKGLTEVQAVINAGEPIAIVSSHSISSFTVPSLLALFPELNIIQWQFLNKSASIIGDRGISLGDGKVIKNSKSEIKRLISSLRTGVPVFGTVDQTVTCDSENNERSFRLNPNVAIVKGIWSQKAHSFWLDSRYENGQNVLSFYPLPDPSEDDCTADAWYQKWESTCSKYILDELHYDMRNIVPEVNALKAIFLKESNSDFEEISAMLVR